MGTIKAICISDIRGVQKYAIPSAEFRVDHGIVGDAHAGNWHRQVSLLSYDRIQDFNKKGAGVQDGAFGENLVVEGFDFKNLPVGTVFQCGEVVLEMTQIGKECHSHCEIFKKMGECIMPKEGVFAKVLQGGMISVGDEMRIVRKVNPYPVAIITVSDSSFEGLREDKSGPEIERIITSGNYEVTERVLVPDDQVMVEKELKRICDERKAALILTTGGTGLSPRDITPEATLAVADKLVPGISEAIRAYSLTITRHAMLSRAVSVIRKNTWIINLPGSPKAVRESLEYVMPALKHGLDVLWENSVDCANTLQK